MKYQKVTASAHEAQENGGDDTPAAPTVRQDDIVKGYEYTKGKYVLIEPRELTELRVPSKHTMEVTQFVDEAEIDPEYYEKPYFVMPEDDTQAQAFAVVRQALVDTKKIALSKIAFGGREHIVAIAPAADAGMMAYTMRYASELRDAKDYFRDIKRVEPEEESLELAKMLIKRKSAKFEPQRFVDGYEVALKELVQAKIDHAPIPKDEVQAPARGKVVSLMDALRKSIGGEQEDAVPRKKPAARHGAAVAEGITLVPGKAASKTARRKSA